MRGFDPRRWCSWDPCTYSSLVGDVGTTPPSSSSRHHRYRWIGWRSRSFYPPPWKNKTHGSHPPQQQCAPSPVLEQVDGRPRPVFEGIGGRPPITGFEPAPSRRAPGALPPGRLPSEIHWHQGHRTNAPATPSPCAKCRPAVGVLCWAMNRNIGAPLQPRSPQPPLASRRESGGPAPGHQVDTSLPPHGNRAGPPQPHARAHNADPDSPPSGRAVGGEGAQDPKRPTQRSKAPPRGRPAAAPTTPSQVGGNRDRTTPPKHARRSTGPGQDTRRGTDHVERPYQRPVPGPREMRAPHHPAGSGHRESASAQTRKGHAGTTGRATGPSARNAQTAWNGVPASEGKGHPDGTAPHTQRGTRGAGRGKKGRHNTRHGPEPPRTGRERRAHTDGTLHPPRQ